MSKVSTTFVWMREPGHHGWHFVESSMYVRGNKAGLRQRPVCKYPGKLIHARQHLPPPGVKISCETCRAAYVTKLVEAAA